MKPEGVYDMDLWGVYEKLYKAFTEMGVYKNLLPAGAVGGGQRKCNAKGGGSTKISEFCPTPSDIKLISPYLPECNLQDLLDL